MNICEISQVFDEVTSLTRAILRDIIDQEDNPELSHRNANDAREALRTLQGAIELLLQDV